MPGIFSYLDLFPAMTENCSARVCVCVGGKKGHDSAIDIGNSFNKQTTTGPITCVLVMVSAPGRNPAGVAREWSTSKPSQKGSIGQERTLPLFFLPTKAHCVGLPFVHTHTHRSSRFCCTTCLSLYGPSRDCFLGR